MPNCERTLASLKSEQVGAGERTAQNPVRRLGAGLRTFLRLPLLKLKHTSLLDIIPRAKQDMQALKQSKTLQRRPSHLDLLETPATRYRRERPTSSAERGVSAKL